MSRYRDPQLQVGENYPQMHLKNLDNMFVEKSHAQKRSEAWPALKGISGHIIFLVEVSHKITAQSHRKLKP